jgi:hypothetical protein
VDDEPLTALVPDQPPDAVHEVAFVELHVSVELAPVAMELGLAVTVTVGAGGATDTVADCAALPPGPVQLSVYVALAVSVPVEWEPLTAWAPDQAPLAVQEVALLDDQESIEALPLLTVLGLALRLTVALGVALTVTVADCAALPPAPVHVRV